MKEKLPTEKVAYMNARIDKLKSEIYIMLIDDLFFDYSKAEKIIEASFFIQADNRNKEIVTTINNKILQVKKLQSLLNAP